MGIFSLEGLKAFNELTRTGPNGEKEEIGTPDEDENDKSVSKPVLVKNEYGLCTTARYQYIDHFWVLEYGEVNGCNIIHSNVVEWMDIPGDNKD